MAALDPFLRMLLTALVLGGSLLVDPLWARRPTRAVAESLFVQGRERLQEGKLEEALSSFSEAGRLKDFAPAHAARGWIHWKLSQKDEAKQAFRKALRIDSGNVAALRGMGTIHFKAQDWGRAKGFYGRLLAERPEDREGLYRRAVCYRETGAAKATVLRWLDWRRSERLFSRLERLDPSYEDVYLQHALLKRYRHQYPAAISLGHRQVEMNPEMVKGKRGLFRLYQHYLDGHSNVKVKRWLDVRDSEYAKYFRGEVLRKLERYPEADSVLQAWIGSNPPISRIPAHLSLAKLNRSRGEGAAAEAWYEKALEGIQDSLDAQLLFDDMKYVVTEEEMGKFGVLSSVDEFREFFRTLWVSRDPTPAVKPNVRLLEHFRRLLLAEDLYVFDGFRTWTTDPDKFDTINYPITVGLNDRFSDMGLVYIRHGEPFDRRKVNFREGWIYKKTEEFPEMKFNFAGTPSAYGSDWRLVERLLGGQPQSRVRWEAEKEYRIVAKSVSTGLTTDRHSWEEKIKPLEIPSEIAFFKGDEGRGVVALSYALPMKKLERVLDGLQDTSTAYEYGLTFHDMNWQPLESTTGRITKDGVEIRQVEDESIGSLEVDLPSDSSHVAFFVRPSGGRMLGGWKGKIEIPRFSETELAMSSVVTAFDVSPDPSPDDPFRIRGFRLVPNPSKRFDRKKPVYVYFEVYNLTPAPNGTTQFEVEYTLTQLRARAMKRMLGVFGSGEKLRTAISLERVGEEPNSPEYLSLDLSRAGKGDFKLEVTVRDRNARTSQKQSTEIELY